MNYQTKKKIKDLKEMISQQLSLKEIIEKKFSSAPVKKNKWLKTNSQYFTTQELDYLDYQKNIEIVEEGEEGQGKDLITNSFLNYDLKKLSVPEKSNLILNSDFLEIIQKMANDYIQSSIKNKSDLVIPQEFFNLKDISIKNCRISNSIYNDFVELAKAKNITITALINYVLSDFISKNK